MLNIDVKNCYDGPKSRPKVLHQNGKFQPKITIMCAHKEDRLRGPISAYPSKNSGIGAASWGGKFIHVLARLSRQETKHQDCFKKPFFVEITL